jgi:hypothetical protein
MRRSLALVTASLAVGIAVGWVLSQSVGARRGKPDDVTNFRIEHPNPSEPHGRVVTRLSAHRVLRDGNVVWDAGARGGVNLWIITTGNYPSGTTYYLAPE